MADTYAKLRPAAVWTLFAEIDRIPRGSGNEAAVMAMLEARAKSKGFSTKRDAAGNLLIEVPATKGREKAPVVVLQGHVDMVCEKNAGLTHDFMKDPIVPRVKGGWVVAGGTTLGADNAIGVSMALAAAEDPKVAHGPLEILLTVDEERGLSGATGIRKGFFTGKLVVNLDSEDDTTLTISCAGLRESILTARGSRTAAPGPSKALEVFVHGLRGGHSGIDINKGRGNAIQVLVRALLAAADVCDVRLSSVDGGNKRNAIPREARSTAVVASAQSAAFEKAVRDAVAGIRTEELADTDAGLAVEIRPSRAGDPFSAEDTRRILNLLTSIPHGVVALSQSVPGLVESSSNLATVSTEADRVRIACTSRSSLSTSLDLLARRHRALAALSGAQIEQLPGVPGWKPDWKSPLLATTIAAYKRVFGRAPGVKGIHAGLECGVFKQLAPEIDTVSFGPDIEGPHSPDERVSIESVERVWKLLGAVLGALSKGKSR